MRFKTDDTINWKGFSAAFVLASPDAVPATPRPSLGITRRYDKLPYKPKGKKYLGKPDQPIDDRDDVV